MHALTQSALRASRAVLFASVWLLSVATARAQGNDRSSPSGGRSTLMGNTGVALGRDGSAPFQNPATIVGIGDQAVAFSVNFFSIAYEHYTDWHQPGTVDASRFGPFSQQGTSEASNTFKALPSTLCLFLTLRSIDNQKDENVAAWRAGKHKLAICLGSLEAEEAGLTALSFNGVTAAGTTAQVQSINRSWNRFSIGPTYSIALSDSFAVGASLHGVATGDTFTLQETAGSSVVGGGVLQSALGASGSGHSIDGVAILGGTLRRGPLTVGLSAQVPVLHAYGKYSGTLSNQYAAGGSNTATLIEASGDFHAPPPVRLAAGIGSESKRIALELDASYDFAQNEALSTSADLVTTTITSTSVATASSSTKYVVPGHGAVNVGAGAEYFLSPSFSLVGGLSTNFSSLRPLAPTMTVGNLAPARESTINLSFGIGSYGRAGDLMLGTQLGFGWGQAVTANPYTVPNQFAVIDTQTFSALLVLAGTTNLHTLVRAAESVEEVVTEGRPDDAPKTQPSLIDPIATPEGLGARREQAPTDDATPNKAPPTSPTDPPSTAPDKSTPVKPFPIPK